MSTVGMIALFILILFITILCIFCTYAAFYMVIDMIKRKLNPWWINLFCGFLCLLLSLGSTILVWLDFTSIHRCPNCKSWAFMQTYCTECGNKLEHSTFITCPNCHTDNWQENKYCSDCGAELNKEDK